MNFTFKITVGTTEIEITESADTHQDFIKRLSFFSSIPTKGPNGETDLRFVHRKTSQGHEYYSLISDIANQEYKFGQSQQEEGTMYGKGWEEKYITDDAPQAAPVAQTAIVQPVAPVQPVQPVAPTQPVAVVQPVAPVQPVPVNVAPATQPQAQPVLPAQTVPVAPAPAANAAVNDVLAKYGIGN